jgi:hypothetical protein
VFEVQRAFGKAKVRDTGNPYEYRLNNSWTALFADWLLERHPDMNIERRRRSS